MKLIVDNLAVEYEDQGSHDGVAMLLLHGWKNDLHTFDSIVPQLSSSYRTVRLDLPGFGGSETPAADWKIDDYVDFVNAFAKKLGIHCDILVGHSFGGRIVIKSLARKVLRPRKIVLIASAGIAKRKSLRNGVVALAAKVGKAVAAIPLLSSALRNLRRTLYRKIGSDYETAGVLKRIFLNVIREDLSESARAISVPALLIWGDRDTETPVSDGKRLAQLIPNSRLEVIAGAGHFVHREKSEEVVRIIKNFVAS